MTNSDPVQRKKEYVLVLLVIKYISDKYAGVPRRHFVPTLTMLRERIETS